MEDLYDDLARFGDEVPYVDDAPPPTCNGQEQANRLLARLMANRRQADEVNRVAEAEHRRIEEWAEDRLHGLDEEANWLRSGVEQFMRAHHQAGGGVTLKLPNGELKLRPSQLSIVVDDAEAFVAWANGWKPEGVDVDGGDLVNTPDPPAPKPDARLLKKIVGDGLLNLVESAKTDDGRVVYKVVAGDGDDGEIVPGVSFTRDADERSFSLGLAVVPPRQDA